MTPRGRTNQLLYQAELLLACEAGDDEHAVARRMAVEEGALGLAEQALNAALRELTEHAALKRHDWRELLEGQGEGVAELRRLRVLRDDPESWLARLCQRLHALHGVEGAARREASDSLIVAVDRLSLGDELRWCLRAFKDELAALRETSVEW
ncbi:DUF6586 family protein [Halomonas sp. HP20-15]|uniref:DUF6586 family protein n=1 Tax=Halomonas sp. HP20-15 TaxID=3085901 RepID=UPI002980B26F|nr:DUF6586 family protein [Halomonas sp. HP20-15]MDW5376657.1 DUF6586 family protein [Halomonas sp. HP20-15]